ncbi:MAG: VgrG-related protein [Cyanobacteria bacterium P01_H01_bin.26]
MVVSYRALPIIKIDDEDAPQDILENVLQITVEESLHRPSLFTLTIRNDYQSGVSEDDPWSRQESFAIGKTIAIGFSPSVPESEADEQEESKTYLIEGEITAIETQFTERTQAPIVVRGYDHSHRLHRGRHNRSFQNMTDSDIVKKIAEEVNLKTDSDTVDDSGEPHDYLFQENQTNMAFLRSRAARIGFELFVRDRTLYFRQPKAEKENLELTWLKQVRSFNVRVSSTEQVKSVEVRGWDYTTKQPIIATADSEQVLTEIDPNQSGTETSTVFDKMQETPKLIVVDRPMFKPKEADAMAQALCDELGGQFVVADARADGNPEIRPGLKIELAEMGPYTGEYYVTETRHIYTERVYDTEFSVRGLRGGNLLDLLAPVTPLRPGQTALVGIVTDNEDPENLGRVKVKFPTLTEDHNSNWARVVSIGAANARGFDCLPEINDEVLVAFEHGDIHRPYILGGVWNGEDAPPNSVDKNVQDGKVRLRTIQTRTGHKVQFIEEDQDTKAGVLIQTKGGHQVYLDDSGGLINIQSTGNLSLNAASNLDIKAGGQMTITSSGTMTVKGATILLN